ncbi:MAG TPA: hypothetical protein VJ720_13145, partial [Chitinophaga sp.]|nr:hypothetical protein [Chitinophaga sp.]
MRKITTLFILFLYSNFWAIVYCQQPPIFNSPILHSSSWRQQADHSISVTLNDKEHTLDGFEKIIYTNNSPDTLDFIWFHIWPNAFKNDRTAFSEQLLLEDRTDFYFSGKEKKGYINRLDFKVNGATAATEDHPHHIDIIRLLLPQPLAPGKQLTITTPFHVQLPYNFSGTGYMQKSYQVAIWYPKPAVYDEKGWHPLPYLGQNDLYSEQGNYDVTITVPKEYTLMASGMLQDTQQANKNKSFHYQQKNTTDFSWTAHKGTVIINKSDTSKKVYPPHDYLRVNKFLDTSKKKPFSGLPVPGFNMYDGLMIGYLAHNYRSAQDRFRFVAIPLYGTKSKKLDGLARAYYTWYPANPSLKRIDAGVSAAKFSYTNTIDDVQPKQYAGFSKVAPFIRVSFNDNSPGHKINRYVQLKHFFIREEGFRYKNVINGTDTTLGANKLSASRGVTQLKLGIENRRRLYPYSGDLNIEYLEGLLRMGLTGNYYFNYADDKNGLQVRVFAGKIIYLAEKTSGKRFITTPYHLNLTGPNGEEDYTYSNYFVGRNKFEGWASQQIMIRDGAFKMRTDLLSDKVGQTDNWLAAANFTTGIPDRFNPLSVLP